MGCMHGLHAWMAACVDHCVHGYVCTVHTGSELIFFSKYAIEDSWKLWFWPCVPMQLGTQWSTHTAVHAHRHPLKRPCTHTVIQINKCAYKHVYGCRLNGWRCSMWIKLLKCKYSWRQMKMDFVSINVSYCDRRGGGGHKKFFRGDFCSQIACNFHKDAHMGSQIGWKRREFFKTFSCTFFANFQAFQRME